MIKQYYYIQCLFIIIVSFFLVVFFNKTCPAASASKDFNIVLITIDTLRADHLSCYGYHRKTSPNIDKIAENGIIFKNAIAPSSWTAPSMASLFTSVYPINHGVIHGINYKKYEDKQEIFSDKLITLAEILKAQGYTTFGVASNLHLSRKFGFARGFDYFECLPFVPAHSVNEVVLPWERAIKKSGKYFLWIHYIDPHYPYTAREPWINYYIPKESMSKIANLSNMSPGNLVLKYKELKEASGELSEITITLLKENLLAHYDSEINYVDSYIGELIQKFNLVKNTLLIITSDHVEEFFEYNYVGHGNNLHQETTRIPLIIKLPYCSKKEIVGENISLVDIMPTILHILNSAPPQQNLGQPFGNKKGPLFWLKKTLLRNDQSSYKYAELDNWSTLKAVITPEWKYIYDYEDNTEQLYNVTLDPLERNDFADKKVKQCKKLRKQLFKWVANAKKYPITKPIAQLSPEEREKLEAMGYLHLLQVTADDIDKDGIPDNDDNCPYIFNPTQEDTYPPGGNGCGDACDCGGDFNCNGIVDDSDAVLFKADFGRSQHKNPCTNNNPCNGDFDCDGDVDWADAEKFKEDYDKRSSKYPCHPRVERPYCLYQ